MNKKNIYIFIILLTVVMSLLYITDLTIITMKGFLYTGVVLFIIFILYAFNRINQLNRRLSHYLREYDTNIIASRTDLNGVLTYVSEAFCNISGYTQNELIGQTHRIIRHPEMSSEVYGELWNALKSSNSWIAEVMNLSKDGTTYWVKMRVYPDMDQNGKPIGYYAIGQDITAKKELQKLADSLEKEIGERTISLKHANEALQQSQDKLRKKVEVEVAKNKQQAAQLIQQSRFAQMGEMISMIAHQWRQPLSSITAISNTLSLDILMDNIQKDFFSDRLDSIVTLTGHLSSTIDDFRNFFKEDKEIKEATLSNIVNQSLSLLLPVLQSNQITVNTYLANEDDTFRTYVNEVKQSVLNLVKNAEEVLIERQIINPLITITGKIENNVVIFTVSDNAGGIAPDIIDKIFNPYFSTKLEKDGTGLGLYMSKVIIEEHCNGEMLAMNTNQGAIFTIKLPILKESN